MCARFGQLLAGMAWHRGRKSERERRRRRRRRRRSRERDLLHVIRPRFHEDPLGPRVAQPEMVHQRARPHLDPVLPAELLLAHQGVEAPVPVVKVAAREVTAQVVFLDPVELEVAERFAVPAANGGEAMLAA